VRRSAGLDPAIHATAVSTRFDLGMDARIKSEHDKKEGRKEEKRGRREKERRRSLT
jgi:hypothetical protein